MSGSPVAYRKGPPGLGAHTEEVLHDWLGLEARELEALRRERIV
jgi:crotonobetainyl-CoA:carnitine CoA-transferase CaiB-like acyl-CoA transferase